MARNQRSSVKAPIKTGGTIVKATKKKGDNRNSKKKGDNRNSKKKGDNRNSKTIINDENRPSNIIRNASSRRSRIDGILNNPNWRSIVTLNENPSVAKGLRKSKWDFSHVPNALKNNLLQDHPDSDFFFFGSAPFIYSANDTDTKLCPTISILIVPRGETPPTYVRDLKTDTIITFSEFGLAWKPFLQYEFGDRVYALKQVHGTIQPGELEQVRLWNLMGEDLKRKEKGELDIKKANFVFQKPDGEIRETYVKGGLSTYTNICEGHGMVLKDDKGQPILNKNDEQIVDPNLFEHLKRAIKAAFEATRNEREEHIAMLERDHPSFADIQSVKIFPKNKEILGCECFRNRAKTAEMYRNHLFFKQAAPIMTNDKIGYINESYGTAAQIFPKEFAH